MRRRHWPRGPHYIGKTRRKLAEMLTTALGYDVYPEELTPVTGAWKQHIYDVMPWNGWIKPPGENTTDIGSWDTMTECVRQGFAISYNGPDNRLEASIMVNAIPRKKGKR